jgi:hypothetical protein
MEKLGDKYIQDKQTKLFNKMGVIWAFSTKQFDEQKKDGVKYTQISWLGGLIVPKDNTKEMLKLLAVIHKEGKKINREKYTKEQIIEDELINHEAYITMSIDDTVEALSFYGFTPDDVMTVYKATFEKNIEH